MGQAGRLGPSFSLNRCGLPNNGPCTGAQTLEKGNPVEDWGRIIRKRSFQYTKEAYIYIRHVQMDQKNFKQSEKYPRKPDVMVRRGSLISQAL